MVFGACPLPKRPGSGYPLVSLPPIAIGVRGYRFYPSRGASRSKQGTKIEEIGLYGRVGSKKWSQSDFQAPFRNSFKFFSEVQLKTIAYASPTTRRNKYSQIPQFLQISRRRWFRSFGYCHEFFGTHTAFKPIRAFFQHSAYDLDLSLI